MSVFTWIQQMTGIAPAVQVQMLCTLFPIWAAGAMHLSKDHGYGVLSACVLGLDKVIWGLGKVRFIFNPQIQGRIDAFNQSLQSIDATLKNTLAAQQAQIDANTAASQSHQRQLENHTTELVAIHDIVKTLKPAGVP